MKKGINVFVIISTSITCIILICTFLTSYQFFYINPVFSTYLPVQVSLGVTMGLLSIKYWFIEGGNRNIIYGLISFIACIAMFISIYFVK